MYCNKRLWAHTIVTMTFVMFACSTRAVSTDNNIGENVNMSSQAHAVVPLPMKKARFAYLRHTNGFWQIWLANENGTQHAQLTTDPVDKTRINWSTKQRRLLANQNDGRLFTIDLAGNRQTLDLPLIGMLDAQWSETGEWIAFSLSSTQVTSNNDIWIMRSSGKDARKLTNNPGVSQLPSWRPDNQSLVYSAATGEGFELWQTDLEGNTEQLTVGRGFHFDPVISADDSLIYAANTRGNYDIWWLASKTHTKRYGVKKGRKGKPQQLTTDPAYDAQPDMAAKGHAVVFYSQRGGKKRVWLKHLDANDALPLTPANVFSRSPVWLD